MNNSEKIKAILEAIANKGDYTNTDLENLRQLLNNNDSDIKIEVSVGKNIVGKIEGNQIHVGDNISLKFDEEAIQALVQAIQKVHWQCVTLLKENDYTQVELQSTGIKFLDDFAKQMTDFSQQSVMRYGFKLAFSPNPHQEYFISGGDQIIKRWEKVQNTWETIQEKEITVKGTVDLWFTSVAISPDGQTIAASKAYQVKIWRLGETKALHTLDKTWFSNFFDVFGFDSVAFSPDGKILAANDNQDIKLWDVETGEEIAKLSGHEDKVTCVAFHPQNQQILASCSYDKTIKLWNVAETRCFETIFAHRDAIYSLAFSPDGRILASGSQDNRIKLWNLNTATTVKTLRQHSDGVTCVLFSPNGTTLISGSNDGEIIEWQLEESKPQLFPENQNHRRGVTSIALSPDGKTLISAGRDQTIKVWRQAEVQLFN